MTFTVTIACLLSAQQLYAEPPRPVAGEPTVVSVRGESEPLVGVEITLELPDGRRTVAGSSDERGELRVVLDDVGVHALFAEIDGVRCVTPMTVVAPRRRWLFAIGSVPLGLALLFVHLRRLRRRAGGAV